MTRFSATAMLICLCAGAVMAQAPPQTPAQPAQPSAQGGAAQTPARGRGPGAPTRDPNSPGYLKAKELPDGQLPAATENGNFIIGPTHNSATELAPKDPLDGKVSVFTMESKDSQIYPGIARQQNPNGQGNPADPAVPRPAITIAPAPYSHLLCPRGAEHCGTFSGQRHAKPRLRPSANVLDDELLVCREPRRGSHGHSFPHHTGSYRCKNPKAMIVKLSTRPGCGSRWENGR